MRAFLEFSELVDQADIEGRTAFMWAAGAGALETLDVMLDCGVDLSQSDKNGATGENEMTVLEMTYVKIGNKTALGQSVSQRWP